MKHGCLRISPIHALWIVALSSVLIVIPGSQSAPGAAESRDIVEVGDCLRNLIEADWIDCDRQFRASKGLAPPSAKGNAGLVTPSKDDASRFSIAHTREVVERG